MGTLNNTQILFILSYYTYVIPTYSTLVLFLIVDTPSITINADN